MEESKTIDLNQALILKCKKGDTKAQFEVYKLYSKAMYNTAHRILNNTAEAEDAMQDAFLKAFRCMEEFRFESTFGTWLRRITVNICLDLLRKRKVTFQEISDRQNYIVDEDTLEQPIPAEITVEKIKKLVSELPDGYRTILTLHLFEGFDHEEIAEITGISYGTVRSQYCRARKKLLDEVKQKIKLQ